MMAFFWMWVGGWMCTSFFLWVGSLKTTVTEACLGALVWPFMIPYILIKGRP